MKHVHEWAYRPAQYRTFSAYWYCIGCGAQRTRNPLKAEAASRKMEQATSANGGVTSDD